MVVTGKVIEPKAASATSTYMAVITYVPAIASNAKGGMTKLSFYCPATMAGHPMESAYNGSSVVEAPIYPHNNADRYNYVVGGVILISYANGDLNTPQFVRFVTDDADVVSWNASILKGNGIPIDETANVDYTQVGIDILQSPRLAKAVALLPYVKKCASNDNSNAYYTFIYGANNFVQQDRAYVKAGKYGAELICEDFDNGGIISNWDFTNVEVTGGAGIKSVATRHSLTEIFAYFCSGVAGTCTVKPERITASLKLSKLKESEAIDQNLDSHPLATYLAAIMAGHPSGQTNFKNIVGKIYPPGTANEEAYGEHVLRDCCSDANKYLTLTNILNNVYRNEDYNEKISSWWAAFCEEYWQELEKVYACILMDNLQAVAFLGGLDSWDNPTLAIMSVIATAWPLLETAITRTPRQVFSDDNEHGKFMDTMIGYLTKNKSASEFNDGLRRNISDGYAKAYLNLLSRDWSTHLVDKYPDDMQSWISDLIYGAINDILGNWDSLSSVLRQTITTDGSSGTGLVDETGDVVAHIWNKLYEAFGNAYAVAGVMGNMRAESNMRSNNLQNSYETSLGYTDDSYTSAVDNGTYSRNNFINDSAGYGLVQFTYWSLKQELYDYCKSKGVSISDVDAQIECLINHLKAGTQFERMKNANSVREASDIMLLEYENPADQSTLVQATRASYGQEYYDKYAGAGMGPTTSDGSFARPCQYSRVSSNFGWRTINGNKSFHNGIDLANSRGTPIYASKSGTVTSAVSGYGVGSYGSKDGGGFGNHIWINHGNGQETVYAHLRDLAPGITKNSPVSQGQLIGYMDSSGSSTGDHLHFGIRINGEYKNPATFINF